MRHVTLPPQADDKYVEVIVLDATPTPRDPDEAGKLLRHAWIFHLESTDPAHTHWTISRPDDFAAKGFRRAFEDHIPVRIPEIELERDAERMDL